MKTKCNSPVIMLEVRPGPNTVLADLLEIRQRAYDLAEAAGNMINNLTLAEVNKDRHRIPTPPKRP